MSALKLIDDIRAAGGTLELTDGKLIARSIPAGMLKQLRSVKPEVMALLAANDENTILAKTTKEQADKFEVALAALAACGWIGVSAENVARAIADGMTDEAQLVALLEGET